MLKFTNMFADNRAYFMLYLRAAKATIRRVINKRLNRVKSGFRNG